MQRVTVVGNSTDHNAVLNEICLSMADNSSALRDYNQAIAYFKEALTYKPTDTKALLSLAKIYMQVNFNSLSLSIYTYIINNCY